MKSLQESEEIELWGGMECTIARIGHAFRDQIFETGHSHRLDDIKYIAEIGIEKIRFPVLWETIASGQRNWQWHDQRFSHLGKYGIEPIIGLLHHGSGPPFTNLLDPDFPRRFADFAVTVARRYPGVKYFTPINEPLTTARFSCLYGHWYPHHRNKGSFLRALFNQCHAILLAMRRIREINPEAKIVQTEDLGKTFSTSRLSYQAKHENERRWLSLDLLTGRMIEGHPWFPAFAKYLDKDDLAELASKEASPDIIGINHYLTSERFLDHRLKRYPVQYHGGNGRHLYADLEAVRMDLPPGDVGPFARLTEVWERYEAPVAVTEIHHGCTREEQLRWLIEVMKAAQQLKSLRVDIRAVTIWSLFGAMDWNSLLTENNKCYEPGAFDIRGANIRPTILARAAKTLKTGGFDHPVLDTPGWWHRAHRRYAPSRRRKARKIISQQPRNLLIAGARGTLGGAFAKICEARGLNCLLLSRQEMDVANWQLVKSVLETARPWAIINTAGYVRVADAEKNRAKCMRENVEGAKILALGAAQQRIPYVTFSSDLVFDGRLGRPYVETDKANPCSVYGQSKAQAERIVHACHSDALIIRTSAFFGPWDKYNFIYLLIKTLEERRTFYASDTNIVSPTYVPDLVNNTLDLLIDGEKGVWHLANRGAISWYRLALVIARALHLDERHLNPLKGERLITALNSERADIMPSLDVALYRCFKESPLLPDTAPDKLLYAAE